MLRSPTMKGHSYNEKKFEWTYPLSQKQLRKLHRLRNHCDMT
jgi:hypothetical protein